MSVLFVSAASTAHAQTTAQSGAPGSEPRLYLELQGGPTLGHQSASFYGGEAGLRIFAGLDLYIEAGRMGNVGTSKLESDAALIASFLNGAVSSTALKVNYVDAGIRYHLNMIPIANPYVLLGAGVASVATEATFAINGNAIDPAQFGVQLGGDLSGTTRKAIVVVGAGVNVPFMKRFYADVGYRYGQIVAKTADLETDRAIGTQRVVLGIGIRF
jgi:opacity protein-like surface antigen